MNSNSTDWFVWTVGLESDENLAIYAEMIQHEQARRRSVANANRKLDRLKDYMEEFHLHFINGETGELLENVTIC